MTVDAIAALREPVRRAVYDRVAAATAPVSRNEVADAVGIGRTLAAHHLDKLVEAGLLETSSARVNGRTAPPARVVPAARRAARGPLVDPGRHPPDGDGGGGPPHPAA